jgi:tripartite-type tricarboxylate transporter receptor subunit TctC
VKSNPGKISYGSGGIGTSIHVASELFKMMAGVDMIHVPYRGGAPAMTDLMAGQVQVVFNPVPESMEFIRAGKLRPLAVTTATRSEVLPDVPTVSDFVPGDLERSHPALTRGMFTEERDGVRDGSCVQLGIVSVV